MAQRYKSHPPAWRTDTLHTARSTEGGWRKNLGTGAQLFFRGLSPEGEGGTKKNWRENFFGTPKPEIFLSLPHVFGFGRCKEGIFKVTMDISTDMGGICV